MGDLQRSAKMSYLQVLVPSDASEDFAHQLGKSGCMMVSDLNSEMQNIHRPYMKDIIRLQEIEKTVEEIEILLKSKEIPMEDDDGTSFTDVNENDLKNIPRKNQNIENVESAVFEDHKDLKDQVNILAALEEQFEGNRNGAEVMRANRHFLASDMDGGFQENARREQGSYQPQDLESDGDNAMVGLKYISGIVQLPKRFAFQRQIFLITRGNSYILFRDIEGIEDASTFMVLYLGDRFGTQLRRLCDFMEVKIYLTSEDKSEVRPDERVRKLENENERLKTVIEQTSRNLKVKMRIVAHKLRLWKVALIQEKAIRVVLNKFKRREQALECQGWCPTQYIYLVEEAMEISNSGKGGAQGIVNTVVAPGGEVPPTFFEVNKLTSAFQTIVDTYGVPRYREYNPTVPTIITLPFLFAMMFGDIFHGTVVFLIALYLVFNEKKHEGKKLNELLVWLHGGRYMLLFMGFFSIYNGVVYNDCLSLSISFFGESAWSANADTKTGEFNGVYPFGVDPTWHGKSNQIEETNSIKMKMSVLFGVTQMSFGLYLCLLNHIEFRDWVSLIFEWIPQLMFLASFFMYMCFIIVYKWCINWHEKDYSPPSLITILVNFVLNAGTIAKDETQLYDDIGFQANLQMGLFVIMFLSIPVMLCAKPFVLKWKYGGKKNASHVIEDRAQNNERTDNMNQFLMEENQDTEAHAGGHGHGHGEDFDFGEVMIHQMIHTIEYVLGTVSNTASYLRLWALSLAHAELSEVFYQKTLEEMMTSNGFMLFIGVSAFYAMTFCVLIVMDQLECFLHALRLHWVEFQNKFYNADGIPFEPFSYTRLVKDMN